MKPTASMVGMTLFGFLCIGGLAVYLMLFEGSPGALSESHAEVITGKTIFSCRACHTPEGLERGCLGCHEEITAQFEGGRGYHDWLRIQGYGECAVCHSEHNGENFELIGKPAWGENGRETFVHEHVEFGLKGAHTNLACRECHSEPLADSFRLPAYPDHPRPNTYLGLSQDCQHCHDDVHGSGELTRSCEKCHDQNRFKPAVHFNHDIFYPLEGRHASAQCSACHQQDEELYSAAFGSVAGRNCTDCHVSPHRTAAIKQLLCRECHLGSDASWELGRRGVSEERHAGYGFKLTSPHSGIECASCHAPSEPYVQRYPLPERNEQDCNRCHDDPHNGQFEVRQQGCLACHVKDHFFPSIITPGNHTVFPLLGAHRAVACSGCHKVNTGLGVRCFAGTPTSCKACHTDPHGGQFNSILNSGDCSSCHAEDAGKFSIGVYTHKNSTGFFEGHGHRQAACSACHKPDAPGQPVIYATTSMECASCHRDPHRGQFSAGNLKQCSSCHGSVVRWTADRFSHEKDTGFSLVGAHSNVDCKACHLPVPQRDGKQVVQYRPTTSKCEDCHGFETR